MDGIKPSWIERSSCDEQLIEEKAPSSLFSKPTPNKTSSSVRVRTSPLLKVILASGIKNSFLNILGMAVPVSTE